MENSNNAKSGVLIVLYIALVKIWAVTWQNQQNDCAPSEDSDQPGHLPTP